MVNPKTDPALHPWMALACRLAIRGHGSAEPNPLVGCVVLDSAHELAGWGFHRRCGSAHAEVMALQRAGARARGGTAIVTLEPCNHQGRTGPCSAALVAAGILRVIYACPDPHPAARGGALALAAAGVKVDLLPCPAADDLIAPFLHRLHTGLPWVVAKWAHTSDGRMDRFANIDRWISSPRSRGMVHRERGRVEAILTGIGTVLADDPRLTARSLVKRRVPTRVVWDPSLDLPPSCALLRTLDEAPLIVATHTPRDPRKREEAAALVHRGVEILTLADGRDGLRDLLRLLATEHGVCTLFVECGPGLLRHLLDASLVNEAWVFNSMRPSNRAHDPSDAIAVAPNPQPHGLVRCVDTRQRGGDKVQRFRACS